MKLTKLISADYLGDPPYGATRVIRKFIFFPKSIMGEIRFWEVADIEQMYILGTGFARSYWKDIRYVSI